ncbi:hypothetical protein J7438_07965 [Thalassotalea sp. G20_0]|uniref:hypothetical protein n=1 Tax=Thalassotalea sp. G20_0 TaxID=2821093 RepID=UPI001AD9CBA3|nr:hypothetical protein [Thalassotalea sp. G20_0]MBO9494020.1 hypothetical protein [Thalassotalea sp. G20_0]
MANYPINGSSTVVDVLQRISLHPARDIRELIPRLWKEKFGANPLKADLDK